MLATFTEILVTKYLLICYGNQKTKKQQQQQHKSPDCYDCYL